MYDSWHNRCGWRILCILDYKLSPCEVRELWEFKDVLILVFFCRRTGSGVSVDSISASLSNPQAANWDSSDSDSDNKTEAEAKVISTTKLQNNVRIIVVICYTFLKSKQRIMCQYLTCCSSNKLWFVVQIHKDSMESKLVCILTETKTYQLLHWWPIFVLF